MKTRARQFTARMRDALWEGGLSTRPFHLRWPTALLRLVAAVLRDARESGTMRLRARGLAYTTLLSLAPLLALSFSVMKGFGVHNQMEPVLLRLLEPLGEQGADIAHRIIGFVANVNVGVLGAAGFAVLMLGVVAMMAEIEEAFNEIWRVRRVRPFALRLRDYLGVLLIGPFLMFLSVAVTAALGHAVLLEPLVGHAAMDGAFKALGLLAAWLLFAVAFTALYMFMPHTRVQLLPAFAAGAVTAALWKALGWVFGAFIVGSSSTAAIYSAFAALVLFVLWLYFGWFVVLVGASVCYYLQNPSNQSLSRRGRALSLRVQEKIALQACAEIGAEFYAAREPLDAARLSRRMHIPAAAIEDVIDALAQTGILAATGPRARQFIPGRPFDATTVDDMLQALRAADEAGGLKARHVAVSAAVDAIVKDTDSVLRAARGMTLKQLSQGSIAA